ncbi:MAG TPA: phosphate regulon sensor histidine kinase PhoR [Steroidobacteraceae bacterium]|nr:phosphate regulon sensor histidine kinase PhoR [Steroidobacteraceae bacterium]
MTSGWSFALARLLALLAVALAGGLVFGQPLVWVIIALATYLCLQLVNLFRLERWLRLRNFIDPPDMGGAWADVIAQVVRLHRRKRFHKQRLIQLFRELRRSTAAMPDGVIVLNASHEILWFNRTASRLLDLRRKADVGLRIDNLIRAPAFVHYLQAADFSEAVHITWPTGSELNLAIQMIPYGGGQQMMLVRDVTRQAKLEAMRKDFVANASHELRSPLTVISGYLDSMSEDAALDPAWASPVAEMRRQAERMNAIVHDLLELSKLESADKEAGEDLIDVAGMLALLRKEALARPGRPREVALTLDSTAKLLGEEAEIHSAFSNLVANALKFTPADGRIEIRWWADSAGGHLSVSDTGIGIAAEHIPRLTERFYRVDPGRARQHGGSGLGLAIVKHALQRHSARLQIESEEGKGSTFTCHFPRRRIAEGELRPARAASDR